MSNFVDAEKLPKGWQKVKLSKSKPGAPSVLYLCDKLNLAQYDPPTPKDIKEKSAAPPIGEKSRKGAPVKYTVMPQPAGLPRFWIMIASTLPNSGLADIVYFNHNEQAFSENPPRTPQMERRSGGENAAPALPPRNANMRPRGGSGGAGDAPPPLPPPRNPSDAQRNPTEISTKQMVQDFMAGSGDEDEEEDVYTATTEEHIKKSTDTMMGHPFVVSAQNSVVVLVGTASGALPAAVNAFIKQLEGHKIKVFAHCGDLPAQFANFMPAVLEVCSSVVVACTADIHARKCQAITYLRHAKKIGKDVVLATIDSTMDVNTGQFGLLVSEFERFDPQSKSDLKKLCHHVAKLQKTSKTLKKNTVLPSAPDRDLHKNSLTQTAMMLKMAGKSFEFRDDLAESIVLLYSWGRKVNDVYENQRKVMELKQELRAKGFKVWVDVDHMSDIDEKDWPEEVVSAVVQSSLVICCVTNSFHVPSSPVQEAFLLAIDSKVPGESILGIKLTETCDMRVGAYGLYMDQVKYYDFSIDWLDTPAGKDKFDEMDRDIRRLKCFHSSRPHGEEADSEDIYGELEYSEEDGFALPQVEAARNSVMLSYGWGKMVDGSFPSQRRVLQLSQKLQDHGFKVWLDLDHMMGNMDVVMAGAIDKSAAVVACASAEYVEGVNAQKEWLYANGRKDPLKSLFVVLTSSRPFAVDNLFGVSKRKTMGTANQLGKWLAVGGTDAIIDVADACSGLHSGDDVPGFVELCKALERAGVERKVHKIRQEPSLKALERHATKRGQSVRRHKRQAERPMWFVGVQDREVTKTAMAKSQPGDYLVRESNANPGAYVVVFNDSGNVRERKIARDAGKFIMKVGAETVSFTTMEALLSAVTEAKNVATNIIAKLDVKYND